MNPRTAIFSPQFLLRIRLNYVRTRSPTYILPERNNQQAGDNCDYFLQYCLTNIVNTRGQLNWVRLLMSDVAFLREVLHVVKSR